MSDDSSVYLTGACVFAMIVWGAVTLGLITMFDPTMACGIGLISAVIAWFPAAFLLKLLLK